MKKAVIILFLLLAGNFLQAQEYRKDTVAIMIFDRMSHVIGEMSSCSFSLEVAYDITDVELGLVKYFNMHEVYLAGPDRMLVYSRGAKGHRGFWYNGSQLMYYSYDENNYALLDAPDNIMATIDTVSRTYGIEFPAADFFYPTFTDDMIQNFDDIIFAGRETVGGNDCYHIIARNPVMGVQVWVSDDEWFLPAKMVVVYYDASPNAQYEATFSNWNINPVLPDAIFEFTPPPDANELRLMAR